MTSSAFKSAPATDRRWVVAGIGALVVLPVATDDAAGAAPNPAAIVSQPRTEIVVFEDPSSQICQIFRRTIVPTYARSARGTRTPMRFVDITVARSDPPGLLRSIDIVPTAVIMRDGEEIGRIPGYWGPDAFAKMVNLALGELD